MSRERLSISTGWQWRLANSNGSTQAEAIDDFKTWSPAVHFPSVIQMELLAKSYIPDPNIGENERLIQWVSDADWEYRCSFATPQSAASSKHVELLFEGLDTYATVFLNGQEMAKVHNMFVPLRLGVRSSLRGVGEENELRIVFESALKIETALEEKYGRKRLLMRDPRRNYSRKAQYHYGWDWGPVVLTSGPYMPIYLETYDSRIDNVHVVTALEPTNSSAAEVSLTVNIAPSPVHASEVKVVLLDGIGNEVASAVSELGSPSSTTLKASIKSPKLWWPNGHGAQHLYKARTSLLDAKGAVLDERVDQFGVRTIKLVQRPLDDEPGETFMFNVNGCDIFSQGGNWIPADNMLPRITRERYFAWVKMAQRCNLNMIRVWGGGIYETEDFFDACDEMGLLVWHDYAFACGDYPIHDEFIKSVQEEAEFQTIRLRNRASLALLCGGNEDFLMYDLIFEIDYDHDDVAGPFEGTSFPQRKIYLEVLPKIATALAPNVTYWCNSPWKGKTANDLTFGDVHQWNVWHGQLLPYQQYGELSGRFVSEFGMHGYPVMRTVDLFAPDPKDRHPQSQAIDCHNKGTGQETRIARYLSENFRYSMRLEDFVYCTQLLQSEAYGYALRDWKRKFNGRGKESCAGALIWQLNDVYPATSWAFIDYFLRPKPAFYTIRRTCAPISVGVQRSPRSRWIDEDRPRTSEIPSFQIFAHNTTNNTRKARLELTAYDMHTQSSYDLPAEVAQRAVTLAPGQNTELAVLEHIEKQFGNDITEKSLIVLCVRLVDPVSNSTLARFVDWPEPYRYLHWAPDTTVQTRILERSSDPEWEKQVQVSSNRPVKGLFVSAVGLSEEEDEPFWEDNMVDLMPGEALTLGVNGLGSHDIAVRFLGDWEL